MFSHIPICHRELARFSILILGSLVSSSGFAESDFDSPPINYSSSTPTDAVTQLGQAVATGKTSLQWDATHGWLPSLLEQLNVPSASQTLVFSKTSMQFRQISPRNPRAIYFNDNVYVGSVPGGEFIELAAVDPKLGAVFYSIDQSEKVAPVFKRDNGECMACHSNGRTRDVPGFVVRSLYTKSNGQPDFRLGSITTDHTTPFANRFGGWYVTGTHGEMRHRGNALISKSEDSQDPIDREKGANLGQLPTRVSRDKYLEPTSDLVALMLLEHQTQFHNLVTKAGYNCRTAVFQQAQMNKILERASAYRSESTSRRINSASEKLIEYLLFSNEYPLASPLSGSEKFKLEFARNAKRDSQGRSLRDLDLNTRLLRHPCSYLIYTNSFRDLPKDILDRIRKRMLEILTGEDQSSTFSHLSSHDRKNILEILSETHPLFGGE